MRAPLQLLLATLLLAVPAVAKLPHCAGGPCPTMEGAGAPPCHGEAVRADSCCLPGDESEPAAEATKLGSDGRWASGLVVCGESEPVVLASEEADPASRSTPLYTLFRSLLI